MTDVPSESERHRRPPTAQQNFPLLDAMDEAVVACDHDWQITYANHSAVAPEGFARDEVLGRPLWKVYPYLAGDAARDALRRAIEERMRVDVDVVDEGRDRWLEVWACPYEDGLVVTARDVTERRRAERDLRTSRDELEDFVENATVGLHKVAPDGTILWANRAELDLLGYMRDEYVGHHIGEFHADQHVIEDILARLSRDEALHGVEARLRAKDGSIRHVLISSNVFRDDGRFVHTRCFTRDVTDRRQAEEAVRASQAQLRLVTDMAPVNIAYCDTDRRFRFVNRPYAARFGDEPFDMVGRTVSEGIGEAAYETIRPYIDEALAGRAVEFEVEIPYRLVGPRYMRCAYAPDLGADGAVRGFVVVSSDVTERRHVEVERERLLAALEVERRRLETETRTLETINRLSVAAAAELDLRTLVQALTDDATALTGAQFGAFFYNVLDERGEAYTLYTLSGVPAEAFAGFPLPRNTPVFEPTFRGEAVVRLDDVTRDARYGKNPPYHGMPEGHLPVRSYLAVPVVSRSGEVLGGLFFGHPESGVFTENHERILVGVAAQTAVAMDNARLYEQARRERSRAEESEKHYRFMAEMMPQIVWTAGPDGRTDYVNERWTEYVGLGPEEARGSGWYAATHPDDREETLAQWARAVDTGEPFEATYRLRRAADGEYRWFLSRAVAMRGADGRVEKWFGTSTDVHEQKRAEAERVEALEGEREARRQAEEANRAKDEFLAVVSHELRTPLNSMLGWMRLLRSDRIDDATFERGLETIERNVKSQGQLIDDLLDVSRIVTGKLRLNVQPVEVAACVQAALDSVRLAAEAKRIRLEAVVDPSAGPVSGDPERLQQVAWNLLSNAVKFTPKEGKVRIRVSRVASHVEIVVADSGQGISPEFLPHVFERFRQADASITRSTGGLGLGLAIVRHLVELHGGAVRVESEGEGKGATFTVRLPLMPLQRSPAEFVAEPRSGAAAPEGGFECPPEIAGVKVLVVDDEPDAREMLSVVLESCEAEVRTAASAAEGLDVLDAWSPDLLVSDIGMPREDGYEFIKRVRARGPERGGNVPAVALTAYARYEDRMRALASGFQMHVAKPVEPAELLMVVHSLLEFKTKM